MFILHEYKFHHSYSSVVVVISLHNVLGLNYTIVKLAKIQTDKNSNGIIKHICSLNYNMCNNVYILWKMLVLHNWKIAIEYKYVFLCLFILIVKHHYLVTDFHGL